MSADLKIVLELSLPLFLIMDPVANSVSSLAILKNYGLRKQRLIIVRELFIALGLMLIFQFLGQRLMLFLDIHQSTLNLAGGVILFIISLKLIFPEDKGRLEAHEKDPFIVPIATPFVAGPSLLAAIMLYSHGEKGGLILFLAILLAWAATLFIMLLLISMENILGQRGGRAAERLMGLILVLLSVQMLEEGVRLFLTSL